MVSLKSESTFIKKNICSQEKEELVLLSVAAIRNSIWNQNLYSNLKVLEHISLLHKV